MPQQAPIFETRLAGNVDDVRAAQRLRYDVFVEELGADGPFVNHDARLERDAFDEHAEQLLLLDLTRTHNDRVIGVYRFMDDHARALAGAFYSSGEYDLTTLERTGRPLMELGRSCVHRDYRGGAAMMHLWQALAEIVRTRGVEVLFGVASFHGVDLQALAQPLSVLSRDHSTPPDLYVRSKAYQDMALCADIDRVAAMKQVPALIKAYLRLGGFVGDGAFVDRAFNTTDVCLVLDTTRMNPRQCMTWEGGIVPTPQKIGPKGWIFVVLRGGILASLITIGLLLMLLVRLIERPLCGQGRPVTPFITQFVCRMAFVVMGIAYKRAGSPMRGSSSGAIVANHSSWLDIFALNAAQRVYFVSKAEVAKWPGIGWLARATGTVFIARDRREAATQVALFRQRLGLGHKLLFFPEGTSTDGQQVLPFKPTLFAAFMDEALREALSIQPVAVIYTAPDGEDARLYGWWGDMDFGPHLLTTLAQSPQGSVTVIYGDPVRVGDFSDRKALAAKLEEAVRLAHSRGESS